MIQPLKDITEDEGKNGLLTRRYVHRLLKFMLSKFSVTAEGIDLKMTGDGSNLHLRNLATNAYHPFAVTTAVNDAGQTIATIHPGRILTIHRDDFGAMQYDTMIPTVGGLALTEARSLTISANTKIVLRTQWSGTDSSPLGTWSITSTTSPLSTPIIRAFGDIPAQHGTLDLILTEIEDSAVAVQWVNDHLRFCCSFTYVSVDW